MARTAVLAAVCVTTMLGTVLLGVTGLWMLGAGTGGVSEEPVRPSHRVLATSTSTSSFSATPPPAPSQAQTAAFSLVTNQLYKTDDKDGMAMYGAGLLAYNDMGFSYGGVGISPGSTAGAWAKPCCRLPNHPPPPSRHRSSTCVAYRSRLHG